MKERFLLGAFVFHAIHGAACIWVARRWHERRSVTRRTPRAALRARAALLGGLTLGLLAVYGQAYHREPTDLRVRRQGTLLHVSRGVGMERGPAPQMRFLVPPEVCVLDLTV